MILNQIIYFLSTINTFLLFFEFFYNIFVFFFDFLYFSIIFVSEIIDYNLLLQKILKLKYYVRNISSYR